MLRYTLHDGKEKVQHLCAGVQALDDVCQVDSVALLRQVIHDPRERRGGFGRQRRGEHDVPLGVLPCDKRESRRFSRGLRRRWRTDL